MRAAPYFCLLAIHLMSCGGAPSQPPHPTATTRTSAPQPTPSAAEPARPRSPVVGIPTYVPQAGHFGEITALAWNRAGSLIATSSRQDGVKLWAMPEAAAVAELQTRDTDPANMAFSPDGRSLAVANWNGALELWDLGELRPRVTHRDHKGSVQSLAYTPDGALLLSGGDDGTIQVYETRSQKLRGLITGMPAAVYAMAFSPDGRRLACSAGSKVQIRETGTWRPLHALEGHEKPVTSVAWSPDGHSIATGGEDGQVIVWDAEKGSQRMKMEASSSVEDLSWAARGDLIAAGQRDGYVGVWNARTGDRLREWQALVEGAPLVSFQPGSTNLATGNYGYSLRDVEADKQLLSVVARGEHNLVSWNPSADRLLTGALFAPSSLLDVDAMTASPIGAFGITWASWDRSGTRLATLGGGHLQLMSLRDGKSVFSSDESWIRSATAALSPDGNTLALFETGTGEFLLRVPAGSKKRLQGAPIRVNAIVWSPDGSRLALAGDTPDLRLWQGSGSGEIARLATDGPLSAVAFSQDGRRIAASERDTGRIRIWDATSRKPLAVFEGPVRASSLAFSPDDRWLAAASMSGVRVWDSQSGALRRSVGKRSLQVSWHHSSKVLAVAGDPVGLIRVDDDEELRVEIRSTSAKTSVALVFTTDGLYDGTPSDSSVARFRVGTGVVDFGLITASQLPGTYKHPGLLREFLEGHPLPHRQAGVAAQPH